MVVTLEEVKEHLRYESTDTSNDFYLNGLILAADKVIKNYISVTPYLPAPVQALLYPYRDPTAA